MDRCTLPDSSDSSFPSSDSSAPPDTVPPSPSSGSGGSSGSSRPPNYCDDPAHENEDRCQPAPDICQTMPEYCGGDDDSDGGNSSASWGGCDGFWCDCHPEDSLCENASEGGCNVADLQCQWDIYCSKNPHNPECGTPNPPGGSSNSGGGTGGTGGDGGDDGGSNPPGGSSGSAAPDSSGGGAGCKDLSDCDWAKLEIQLKELGVAQTIRDSLANLIDWLRRKRHEDSLITAMRWAQDAESRGRMLAAQETINGRIYEYFEGASERSEMQTEYLRQLDSAGRYYYSRSLEEEQYNRTQRDSLNRRLELALGDGFGDLVTAIDLMHGTLTNKGFGGGDANVDMSGVEGGLGSLGGKLDGIGDGLGDGFGSMGSLLGRLDSTLSAGNGNILGMLDSLGRPCQGDECGNYDGIGGEDSFGGLDTNGLSAARWDSLLAAPGASGLQDSASALAGRLRAATATPFAPGMACPAEALSIDACGAFGSECRASLCDSMFYVSGRHFFEWIGLMFEFVAWVLFLVRIA